MKVETAVNNLILPVARTWRDRVSDPSLTVLLVLQLVIVLILAPFSSLGYRLPEFLSLLFLTAQVVIVLLLSPSKRAMLAVALSLGLAFTAVVTARTEVSYLSDWLNAGGQLVGRIAVGWVLMIAVFGPGRVNHHRIMGAVTLFLNIGLAFAAIYQLIDKVAGHAFASTKTENFWSLSTMIYFSFITLTTTGFGDITPLNPFARSFANLEAIVGQLFPATLLARIVTLEIAHRNGEMGKILPDVNDPQDEDKIL